MRNSAKKKERKNYVMNAYFFDFVKSSGTIFLKRTLSIFPKGLNILSSSFTTKKIKFNQN